MIRVTTNGTLYNYKSNFNQTANQLNSAMMKLMTGRNFDSYSANPAGATRAFQIHSSINATNAQYDNNQTVLSKFETAWSSIQGILDGYDGLVKDARVPALSGLNGTNLDNLNTQGQIIRENGKQPRASSRVSTASTATISCSPGPTARTPPSPLRRTPPPACNMSPTGACGLMIRIHWASSTLIRQHIPA